MIDIYCVEPFCPAMVPRYASPPVPDPAMVTDNAPVIEGLPAAELTADG